MRISDWSSDVCSSDLQRRTERGGAGAQEVEVQHARQLADRGGRVRAALDIFTKRERQAEVGEHIAAVERSEEHTSELQSLMRISYAVFCLKKKTKTQKSKQSERNK